MCECVDPPEEDAAQSRAIRVWIAAPETITVVTWLWPKKSVNRAENLHRKVSLFSRPKNLRNSTNIRYIVVIEYFGKYTDTNILLAKHSGYYFIKVPLLSHLCSLPTNKPLCICWILVLMPVQLAKIAFAMTMTGRLDVDLAWVLHT